MTETLFEVPESWWCRRRCQVCGGALSLEFTHTYVVQRQWWVKIGATNRPRQRFNELARYDWRKYIISPAGMDWHEPLSTVLVLEGNIEHELHERFAGQHVAGEWFLPHDTLADWLREQDESLIRSSPQRLEGD